MQMLPFFASAIALSLSLSALPAFAQSTTPDSPAPNSTEMRGRGDRGQGRMHRQNWLNLTEEQQTELQEIREDTRSQIDEVLTDEQRAQIQSQRESRQASRGDRGQRGENRQRGGRGDRRAPFESLNLTEEQRAQIEEIRQASQEEMDAVLTDEQRQQVEQHRQDHQQRQQLRQSNSQEPFSQSDS
ncbi:MAG: hypothetical protein MUF49_30085 [Oculatellaceae cyanobacterium Prado106]|nr:hypothetical protein [Oculatellaceae cyanobacterium Prado106]